MSLSMIPLRTLRVCALSLILTLALCPLLTGCAHQTDEEAIESSIAKRLDGYKNPDSSETANFAARMDIDSLSQYGVSMADFMRAYLDGFDYEITSVDVDDDTATATVVMRCKSFSGYETALAGATSEMGSDQQIATMTTDELDEAFGEAILASLEGVEVRDTDPITITFEKTDNVWMPVSDASDDIAAALLSN